jgi:putative transposase
MSIRKVNFVKGEYYHIYNRGNGKQKIFHDKEDYLRIINLLYTCNSTNNFKTYILNRSKDKNPYLFDRGEQLVSIGAYTMMPNHFHILITESKEGGISKFMQKLTTAYVMYYNQKYDRAGGLFEGKFKSAHASGDKYLKYLFSYIHLNPVKILQKDWKEKGIKNKKLALEYLSGYKYSSYVDYTGENREQNMILNRENFPNYFPTKKNFMRDIIEWLGYNR